MANIFNPNITRVVVEYGPKAKRESKEFTSVTAAGKFYAQMLAANASPILRKVETEERRRS
jgi:hypothetical protein